MMNLIKSDFKKIFYLPGYRKFLVMTFVLSIVFGAIFLFTIGITQGEQLTDLSFMEMIDISFLGIDVAAIMLIIFTAMFISKDLAPGAVHTNLAITPVRRKYFLSKILFLAILFILISITVVALLLITSQFIATANGVSGLSSAESGIFLTIIGSVIMVLFYGILSAAGTFYIQSTAGGITFALAVMFLPALIKMFSADVSDALLAIFPENALQSFIDINSVNGSLTLSVATLLAWIIISSLIGLWKFKRIDY
jgi:ABC-type transport system involved in multi-copper enzyme maturation permease subunit